MSNGHRDIAIAALAVTAFGLGFWGFWLESGDPPAGRLLASLISTIQLFVLQVGPEELRNWRLQVAALIAPLSTGSAAATALMRAYREQLDGWKSRRSLRRRPADVLFIGGGHFAATRARYVGIRDRKSRIAVLDRARDCEFRRQFERSVGAAAFLVGNALDPEELRRIGAQRAREVWIGCGSDLVNIEALRALAGLASSSPAKAGEFGRRADAGATATTAVRARWRVDLGNRELLRMVDPEIRSLRAQGIEVEAVNVDRDLARELLATHPPAIPGPAGREQGPLHIAILGATDLAEEILIHAVHHFVLDGDPAKAVRITWFGEDVERRLTDLRKRYPALEPQSAQVEALARVLPVAHLHSQDCDERTLGAGVWVAAQREFDFSVVYVACRGIDRTLIAELRCVMLRDADPESRDCIPEIVIAGLYGKELQSRHGEFPRDRVTFFEPMWTPDGPSCDEEARRLNASYRWDPAWDALSEEERDRKIHELWGELSEDLRWSSRLGADHASCVRARLYAMQGMSGESAETLARIEHRRFVVERLMGGWLPVAKGKPRKTDHPPGQPPPPARASGARYGEDDRRLRLSDQLTEFDEAARLSNLPRILKWMEDQRKRTNPHGR